MADKKKPSQTEALAGRSHKEGRESLSLHEKLEKYSKAKHRQGLILNHLQDIATGLAPVPTHGMADYAKLHGQISSCFNYLVFNDYYTVGETRLVKATSCKKHLLCAPCAIRRAAKSVKGYLERFETLNASQDDTDAYMLTLTVKNGHSLQERFEHLQKAMKAILKTRRNNKARGNGSNEFCKFHGGVYSYELTKSCHGWHPHIHMVVTAAAGTKIGFDPKNPKDSQLSKQWLAITGDSFIVDCRPLYGNIVDSFIEVFKYALKFSDLDPSDTVEAFSYLRGKRLQGSFGCFRGVEIPEGMNEDPLSDLPYVELIYKYMGNHFNLTSHKKVDV